MNIGNGMSWSTLQSMPRKSRSRGQDIIVAGPSAQGLAYNCPHCDGVLLEMDAPKTKRYRCQAGHSFTATTLLASQSEKIEEMLWISLRMFEERKHLLKSVGKTVHRSPAKSHRQLLGETQGYIDRLRGMLVTAESQSPDDTFTRVKGLMAEPTQAKSTRRPNNAAASVSRAGRR